MNFKSILFSTEMVQAILDGRKTQTRRILKSRHESGRFAICKNIDGQVEQICSLGWDEENVEKDNICPYGHPGDVLWVRESWNVTTLISSTSKSDVLGTKTIRYKADNDQFNRCTKRSMKWKPSIYMPKEACRLFLKVKNVRVERLQDITEEDAIAEGIEYNNGKINNTLSGYRFYVNTEPKSIVPLTKCPINSFRSLWEKINGIQSWKTNPWVWVISFERINKPENFK